MFLVRYLGGFPCPALVRDGKKGKMHSVGMDEYVLFDSCPNGLEPVTGEQKGFHIVYVDDEKKAQDYKRIEEGRIKDEVKKRADHRKGVEEKISKIKTKKQAPKEPEPVRPSAPATLVSTLPKKSGFKKSGR